MLFSQIVILVSFFLFYIKTQEFGSSAYNNSMFWGTYQPQNYFGMKTRSSVPVKFGMMFNHPNSGEIRHEGNEDLQFGWVKHNGVDYGKQEIIDSKYLTKITTEFVKDGGVNGGGWSAIVRGHGLKEKGSIRRNKMPCSLLFYISVDGDDDYVKMESRRSKKGADSPVVIKGMNEDIGEFKLVFSDNKQNSKFYFQGSHTEKNRIWNVRENVEYQYMKIYYEEMMNFQKKENKNPNERPVFYFNLNNTIKGKKQNVILIQKTFVLPFEFKVSFVNKKQWEEEKKIDWKDAEKTILDEFIPNTLPNLIRKKEKEFDEKFDKIFNLPEKVKKMSMFSLSNLLGGIGYFQGDTRNEIYDLEDNKLIRRSTREMTQFTAVPSRSKFPRSFLWDSGFHLELILKWDKNIGMDILTHWFNSMFEDGWIPREQILGDEARTRVPQEFQLQKNTIANPPTLFMAIENNLLTDNNEVLVDSTGNVEQIKQDEVKIRFLKGIYQKLKKNYEWYMKSQKRKSDLTFQWRGRTVNHTLASGFDDYPFSTRPVHTEKHLDLYCWMFLMSRTMMKVSSSLNEKEDYEYYKSITTKLVENFKKVHFDESQGLYANFIGKGENETSPLGYSIERGYISLFPLLVGITEEGLEKIFEMLEDENQLFSNFGIRSLSKSSKYYGTSENYWRGKIWVNINYMTLRSLKKWTQNNPDDLRVKELYKKIRKNLFSNIRKQYINRKTLFENYDPEKGDGTGTHPFTGWTSLILLIMTEKY